MVKGICFLFFLILEMSPEPALAVASSFSFRIPAMCNIALRAHIAEKGDHDIKLWGKCRRIKMVDVQVCNNRV